MFFFSLKISTEFQNKLTVIFGNDSYVLRIFSIFKTELQNLSFQFNKFDLKYKKNIGVFLMKINFIFSMFFNLKPNTI